MEANFTVYVHTAPNKKKYVGITAQEPIKRWGLKGQNYKNNGHFWNAIQKYGWDNFQHDIVAINLNKHDACQMEKDLIKLYKSHISKYGYNKTTGGEHFEFSDDIKPKLRSPEGIRKMAESKRGQKQSEETKAKRAEALRRFYKNGFKQEHRDKISNALKGIKRDEEFCRKMKEVHRTELNKRSRRVVQFDGETAIAEYLSAREAERETGISYTSIVRVCNGVRLKHAGGYRWEYAK